MAASLKRDSIRDITQLEELVSEPDEPTIQALRSLEGDVIILGVGGKMGPTLARMAKRALKTSGSSHRVIGVSRFSSPGLEKQLQSCGIETISGELLDRKTVSALPDAPHVVYMAGRKFGSTGLESLTWAMNSFLPGLICERYRNSRIAVFSTGNVYGLSAVTRGGSREEDVLQPVGEYAMSCLGRERICEHFGVTYGTKIATIRLNYACELRYGVLLDIAQRVYAGQPVPLSMGYFNAIWQGDACAMSLRALACALSPPFIINIAGPELLSVRAVAEQFGKRWGKPVRFAGKESEDALLSNAQKALRLFGQPRINVEQMMKWIVDWVERGGEIWSKPTHFEDRAGRF